MTIRYVGIGGNDGNSGLTWVLRKLTLNGAEDTPVAAGDTVYVGPGTYRELLQADVNGGAGNPITYIGDVTGEHTDGVGGIVRVTGSNDDLVATRAQAILCWMDYRTFRGFYVDLTTSTGIATISCESNIVEDCFVTNCLNGVALTIEGGGANCIVRRCIIIGNSGHGINQSNAALEAGDPNHLIENCIIVGGANWASCITNINGGGVDVKNCLIIGNWRGVYCDVTGIAVCNVTNSIIMNVVGEALSAQVAGDIVENYNTLWGNTTNRVNVNVGANSNTYPPLFMSPLQLSGHQFPSWMIGQLSPFSQIRAITGTAEATDDVFGQARPVTSVKKSWGAVQYADVSRSSTQAHGGTYSAKFADAGRKQFIVPVTAINTTFSVYVYREANYAGVNPQMVIKQPNVADTTVLDAGAAGGWNLLTTALVPAALPPYVIVELVSNNTAVAGAYNTYFDDLTVS